jgi:hypothetical protein
MWDIDDAEKFCSAIVGRSGLQLSFHDREDLAQWLLGECWQLSLCYDTGDPKFPPCFSNYATIILRRRVVDWQPKRLGRTVWKFRDHVHERPRPQLLSLDDRVESDLGEGPGDPEVDRSPDLARILGKGSRPSARDYLDLGLKPPRRAAG